MRNKGYCGINAVSELDPTDRRILQVIQENADFSTAEVAERVGLSQAPCWRRIRRMEDEGIIRRRVTLIDRRLAGLPILVFASIKLEAHGESALPDFDEAVRRFPEVIECYTLMGSTDYLLKIVVPDVEAYETFLRDKLYKLPAIRETNSAIALSEIKNTTALPL